MIERYQYYASTIGVSGRITEPFDEIIPVQTPLVLPESGGFATARADHFDFRGIVSFETAEALVSGSFSDKDKAFSLTSTVTITGLNILSVVTADRVVARIASKCPIDPAEAPSITPLGSYYDNLRIAGRRVELDLAIDTFTKFNNAARMRAAYKENQEGFRDKFDKLTLLGRTDVASRLCKYFPDIARQGARPIEQSQGVIACSVVNEIRDLPYGLQAVGHLVHVPDFGIIRLAEYTVTDSEHSINMLQVDLGCSPSGNAGGPVAGGGGWGG